ncbi:MAG: type II toxin-antitoxin system HicB family antitoxin [Candidatus Eremiobacteraeota bacterium]|nr:type II toxin-antitoxin system HicB family antitoxin [Candidatus Eremiobacteraeota bacterium]
MKTYIFQVVIEPDEDGFHAFCPILKGCHTWGKSRKEAVDNVKEAVLVYVEDMIESGESLPVESELTKIMAFDTPSVAVAI